MPVEAIHLSAYQDSLERSSVPARLRVGRGLALGRLGALVIDFPYFERFPLGVLRYLLKQPTARSTWGDALHRGTPVAVAQRCLDHVRRLRTRASSRAAADEVLSLCLGYVSHLAVDRSLHPLVNELARARAARIGGEPAHQHTEVEKFHSVLFHQDRLGFDFMGRRELAEHIAVDGHAVHREAHLRSALCDGLQQAVGKTPSAALLEAWARGYGQYVALVSSPAGKLLVPERIKQQVREEVYGGAWGTFVQRYERAVEDSRVAMDAALAWADDATASEHFATVLPEGPIDLD